MYRCFKLDISESDFFDLLPAAKATWKRIGVERKNEQKLLIDDFLETVPMQTVSLTANNYPVCGFQLTDMIFFCHTHTMMKI